MTKLSMFLNKHVVSFIIVISYINPSFICLENEKGVENTSDGNDYEYDENSYDYGYSVDEEEEEVEEEETFDACTTARAAWTLSLRNMFLICFSVTSAAIDSRRVRKGNAREREKEKSDQIGFNPKS